ncbi:MAG: acyl-CoA dehydrogenase family protein, partial [Acidilobus sp.]
MGGESIELLRASVREFAEKVVKPVARQIDKDNTVPPEVVKQVADMGYFA